MSFYAPVCQLVLTAWSFFGLCCIKFSHSFSSRWHTVTSISRAIDSHRISPWSTCFAEESTFAFSCSNKGRQYFLPGQCTRPRWLWSITWSGKTELCNVHPEPSCTVVVFWKESWSGIDSFTYFFLGQHHKLNWCIKLFSSTCSKLRFDMKLFTWFVGKYTSIWFKADAIIGVGRTDYTLLLYKACPSCIISFWFLAILLNGLQWAWLQEDLQSIEFTVFEVLRKPMV